MRYGSLQGTKANVNLCALILWHDEKQVLFKRSAVWQRGSLLRAELHCPHKGKWGGMGLSEVRIQTIWNQRSLNLKICRVLAKSFKDIGESKEQRMDLAGRYFFLFTVHRQLLEILAEKTFFIFISLNEKWVHGKHNNGSPNKSTF